LLVCLADIWDGVIQAQLSHTDNSDPTSSYFLCLLNKNFKDSEKTLSSQTQKNLPDIALRAMADSAGFGRGAPASGLLPNAWRHSHAGKAGENLA
jgi:hypothetical protein